MDLSDEEFGMLQELPTCSDVEKIVRKELKQFKKEIIEEMEKRYCESWCVRKD